MHHLRNSPKITCTPCQSSPKAIDHVPAGLFDGWELIGQSNHNHISPRANQVPSPVMQVPARYSAVEHTCVLPFLITQLRHAPCPACPTICLLNRAATHPFVKDGSSCHIRQTSVSTLVPHPDHTGSAAANTYPCEQHNLPHFKFVPTAFTSSASKSSASQKQHVCSWACETSHSSRPASCRSGQRTCSV